jgi:hypothetical protein
MEQVVKICSEDCTFIKHAGRGKPKGCEWFQRKQVKYKDPCKHDLEMINGFVQAHKDGNLDHVKETVGGVVGSMMLKLYEMLAIIGDQGMIHKEPILDGKGMVIMLDGEVAFRLVEHPLLTKVVTMARAIGFDLSKFKLTPGASGDAPKAAGNILLHTEGPVTLQQIVDQNAAKIAEFEVQAATARKNLEEDPVYQEMKGDQVI